MKFLLDQNVPANFSPMLHELGHKTIALKQIAQSRAKNGEIGNLSIQHCAIIITFDKHFLNLKHEIQHKSKIIYIDMQPRDPIKACDLLREKLSTCLGRLKNPGVVILRLDGIEFQRA